MKLQNIVFACLIILLAFHYDFTQEKADAVLIDDFGAEIYDHFRGQVDNLLVEIMKNPILERQYRYLRRRKTSARQIFSRN